MDGENLLVQLTRMEGTLNLVASQITSVQNDIVDIRSNHKEHELRLRIIEGVQASQGGSTASFWRWLPAGVSIVAVAASIYTSTH